MEVVGVSIGVRVCAICVGTCESECTCADKVWCYTARRTAARSVGCSGAASIVVATAV